MNSYKEVSQKTFVRPGCEDIGVEQLPSKVILVSKDDTAVSTERLPGNIFLLASKDSVKESLSSQTGSTTRNSSTPKQPFSSSRQEENGSASKASMRRSDRPHNPRSESLTVTFDSDFTVTDESNGVGKPPINIKTPKSNGKVDDHNDFIPIEIDIEQPSKPRTREEDFTNDPHPALETPLLYFLLRPFPRLLSAIQAFYNLRWDISYPLQNRIPCSGQLRKINVILTWGELFLLLPFFVLMIAATIYSVVDPSVSISGHTARTPLIFCFVTAMKNNFLTFFLGMPVERAIKYHKLSARLAYLNGLVHTFVAFKHPVTTDSSSNFFYFLFQDQVNIGGTMLVFFMTGMIITALPYIRRKLFELFYFIHIIFEVVMMICAFYHTGFLVPLLGGLTWGLDLVVRKVYMPFFRYPRKATLQIISDSVVELSFSKNDGFDFNPGQYIYIAVPKLGYLEWHPFSLSSSPQQKMVTLHIRKAGGWTNALYDMAKKQAEIDFLMEGPYGSVGVDLTNPYKYQNVMLFSGGIGVTPIQSLCNSLMYEHNHGMRKLKKLSFVWIERDPIVIPEVDVVRRETIRQRDSSDLDLEEGSDGGGPDKKPHGKNTDAAKHSALGNTPRSGADGATDFAAQLLAMVPQSLLTDDQLAQCYSSSESDLLDDTLHATIHDTAHDTEATSETPWAETVLQHPQNNRRQSRRVSFKIEGKHPSWRAGEERSYDKSFLDHAFQNNKSNESPIDLQVYLTNKNVSRATKKHMSQMPFVHFNRPDIQSLFYSARREALHNGHQARIAVCVCAPQRIVDLCRKACAKYSDRYVAFDFHYEVFE